MPKNLKKWESIWAENKAENKKTPWQKAATESFCLEAMDQRSRLAPYTMLFTLPASMVTDCFTGP